MRFGALPRVPAVSGAFLRSPVTLGATLLVVASLALRVLILRDSHFVEDDLLFVGDAYENDLTLGFVTRVHKGHLMPGAIALTWVLSRLAPYDWLLAAGVTLAAQALLSVLAFRLLRLLFGDRPAILPPLAVFLFSPLTVPAFGWWAAAINAVPFQLALVLALTCQVRFARGEGTRYGWRALGWTVFGMAFSTKGVFAVFLLFALTTAFLGDREAGWGRSVLREVRRNRRLWAAYLAVIAAYTTVYLLRAGAASTDRLPAPKVDVALDLAGRLLGRTFPGGAVGGPLTWSPVTPTGGLAGPSDAVVAVAWAVLAAVVLVSVVHRRRAVRAWIVLAAYLVFADTVPTVIARGGYTSLVGAETRYVADAVLVLAVVLGLALLPLRGEEDAYRRPLPRPSWRVPVVVIVTGAYLAASVVSVETYRQTLSGDRVRTYLGTVARQLAAAPDDVVIYPTPLPDDIVLPLNGDRRLSHRLLAPLARPGLRIRMAFPQPSYDARVFDRNGRLDRMSVFGFLGAPRNGERCLPVADGALHFPDAVSFGGPATAGAIAYAAERPVPVTVEVGEERVLLTLRASDGGLIHFPVRGVSRGMRIVLDDPAAEVCVTGVALGAPIAESEQPR
ncbi:hypothetical protein FHS43_001028 [Streptosporangium becharense]|uniref:DUF2079 domain-containing protein n=1 Tax=Streptosporangium becharense TaxID=1816182 RepID=A0A7W9IEL5_9ACTN|nr:hypothetical protein [Streptosporangium becharense]MBB2909782.1 hypothetical protein [Streptosporangium becharense]MBB5819262.1 hypothetical protein [Streptosporangium becharense]